MVLVDVDGTRGVGVDGGGGDDGGGKGGCVHGGGGVYSG